MPHLCRILKPKNTRVNKMTNAAFMGVLKKYKNFQRWEQRYLNKERFLKPIERI